MRTNKERTPSQISNEARPSALGEIWERCAKWGHTISPIHFTQPSTQLLQRKLVVFVRSQIHSYAYHLVSVRGHDQRVRSPIQGFSRCEGISFTPALNKDQHSRGSRPKNDKIISLPLSPRQSSHNPKILHVDCKGKRKFLERFTLAKGNLMVFIDR